MKSYSHEVPAPDHPSSTPTSDPQPRSGTSQPAITGSAEQRPSSPFLSKGESLIWQNAIQRYYEELRRGGIKGPAIDKDLWNIKSPMDLLEQVKNLEPPDSRASRAWLGSLRRLEPILLGLNDFASVTAWALGMDGKVAAVVWGSIRLILNLARPVLPEILGMLEELRRTLPRYKRFEDELEMTKALEDALCDMYTDIIIFCARTITFFRNNPNIGGSRSAWSQFNSDFHVTIENLRSHSRRIDEEGDMIRMTREASSVETLKVIKKLNDVSLGDKKRLPCQTVPYGLNPRFFSRSEEVKRVREALDPREGKEKLRVLAMYGLGGVGKTQLALHYANTSFPLYEVVAWIPSENQIKMTQALSVLAQKLGLPKTSENEDDSQASLKVRDWLNSSGRSFLLIFDNVENIDILLQVWPASTNGSLLITTRSPAVAARRSNDIMHLEPFAAQLGPEALYALTGFEGANEEDTAAAEEICRLLGGLPLAIVQVSDFIRDRASSYAEFVALYQKSSAKILARCEVPLEYNHTLSTVWELSLHNLPQDASTLQKLIAFFDPDTIEERFLTNADAGLSDEKMEFLADEFDFGEAVTALVRSSLIKHLSKSRSQGLKTFSVHRLVQSAVFTRLSKEEVALFHESAVALLTNAFPNTWNLTGPQQGHSWEAWETCSKVLPHVSWLIDLSKKHKIKLSDPWPFAELIFRTGTWVAGILNRLKQANISSDICGSVNSPPCPDISSITVSLSLGVDRTSLVCNQAVRLLGHIALDMAQPTRALEVYTECLESRRKLVDPSDPTIANVLDSIACAQVELNNIPKAFEALEEATRIHHQNDPKRMGRTWFIYSMAHLRAGDPDKSLEALKRCWELQGLTAEEVERSRYPKHSADLVLLSRIEAAKGNKDLSLQLVSKTISIRKDVLGNKGPRVADSMYIVSGMLRNDGRIAVAAKMLREIVDMGKGMLEMKPQVARALWTLGGIEEELGNMEEAEKLRNNAKEVKYAIEGREGGQEDSDAGFDSIVTWLLI